MARRNYEKWNVFIAILESFNFCHKCGKPVLKPSKGENSKEDQQSPLTFQQLRKRLSASKAVKSKKSKQDNQFATFEFSHTTWKKFSLNFCLVKVKNKSKEVERFLDSYLPRSSPSTWSKLVAESLRFASWFHNILITLMARTVVNKSLENAQPLSIC